MNKLFVWVLFLGLTVPVAAEPEDIVDEAWFSCTADVDCTVIEGVCAWTAVNKAYIDEAQRYYDNIKPYVECIPGGYAQPKPTAICMESRCWIPDAQEEGRGNINF